MILSPRIGAALLAAGFCLASTGTFAEDAAKPAAPAPVTLTIPSAQFDDAVHDYLTRHPEAVGDALTALQDQQEAKQAAATETAIAGNAAKVYNDPNSPVAGNPKGSEVLVEFFDYACHYCKQIHPDIQALIKSDPNLKVIYKDFPILSAGSMQAAQAALAAKAQGKYLEFHDALLDYKGQLSQETINEVAKSVGLDVAKLDADMAKTDIRQQINDTIQLALLLNIHGTPSLIINKHFYGGALSQAEIAEKLKQG